STSPHIWGRGILSTVRLNLSDEAKSNLQVLQDLVDKGINFCLGEPLVEFVQSHNTVTRSRRAVVCFERSQLLAKLRYLACVGASEIKNQKGSDVDRTEIKRIDTTALSNADGLASINEPCERMLEFHAPHQRSGAQLRAPDEAEGQTHGT